MRTFRANGLLILLAVISCVVPVFARGGKGTTTEADAGPVSKVAIEGNIRVEEDAIRVHLQTQQGLPFDRDTVDKDIKAIYGMGFFDQVNAEVTPTPKGVVVTFRVTERPLVRDVTVEGNEKLTKEELKAALRTRPHTILDPEKARQGIDAAKKLYADTRYLDAKITYDTVPVGEHEVDVHFKIDEGPQFKVGKVEVEGKDLNKEDTKLPPELATRPGEVLSASALRDDVQKLTKPLIEDGYAEAAVNPDKKVNTDERTVDITYHIIPGRQFHVGKVSFAWKETAANVTKLERDVKVAPGQVFRDAVVRTDVQTLTERLWEDGYSSPAVEAQLHTSIPDGQMDVEYVMHPGIRSRWVPVWYTIVPITLVLLLISLISARSREAWRIVAVSWRERKRIWPRFVARVRELPSWKPDLSNRTILRGLPKSVRSSALWLFRPRLFVRQLHESGYSLSSTCALASWAVALSIVLYTAANRLPPGIDRWPGVIRSAFPPNTLSDTETAGTAESRARWPQYIGTFWVQHIATVDTPPTLRPVAADLSLLVSNAINLSHEGLDLNGTGLEAFSETGVRSLTVAPSLESTATYIAVRVDVLTGTAVPQSLAAMQRSEGSVIRFGFGVGHEPQVLDGLPLTFVQVGFGRVVFANVSGDVLLSRRTVPAALWALFAGVMALCVYLPARLLGARVPLQRVLGLALASTSIALLVLVTASTLGEAIGTALNLRGWSYFITVFGLMTVAMVLIVRAFVASVYRVSGLSPWRFILGGLGAAALSAVAGPLLLVPGAYVVFALDAARTLAGG
jgi:hypothetical protein